MNSRSAPIRKSLNYPITFPYRIRVAGAGVLLLATTIAFSGFSFAQSGAQAASATVASKSSLDDHAAPQASMAGAESGSPASARADEGGSSADAKAKDAAQNPLAKTISIPFQNDTPANPAPATDSAQKQAEMQHWGSVNPENLPPMFSLDEFNQWLRRHRVRYYGWIDAGGQYASTGSGKLELGFPTLNRFSDEPIVDAVWAIVERPLPAEPEGWEWGFRADFYAGQDAALLRPMNNFGPQSARFGTDFRQAFISLHMPILTQRGFDLQLGRQNVPIGYETLMGPYRPLYTATYYWIFHQVGSTAAFGTLHVNKQLDVLAGADLNYNTVYEMRGRAPSYLAKATYTPGLKRKTTFIGDVYTGPKPVPTLPGHYGTWQTLTEAEVRHNWSPRVFQVVQGNYEWIFNDPAEHKKTSVAQGAFSIVTVHLTRQTLDLNMRGEWMHDLNGVRTHFPGTFGESTVGLNVMPVPWINIRPELRGDFASSRVLGPLSASEHAKNQLTAGGDIIFKF